MSPPRRGALALAVILLCASCEGAFESDELSLDGIPSDSTPTMFPFPPQASRALYELFLNNTSTLPVSIHGAALPYPTEVSCHVEAIRPNRGRKDSMPLDERNQIVCIATTGRGVSRVAMSLGETELSLAYGNNLTQRTISIASRIDADHRGNVNATPAQLAAFQNHLGRRLFNAIYVASTKEKTADTIYSIEGVSFGTPGVSAIADFSMSAEILPRPEKRKDPNGPPVAGERAVITCMLNGYFVGGRRLERSLLCAFIDEFDR